MPKFVFLLTDLALWLLAAGAMFSSPTRCARRSTRARAFKARRGAARRAVRADAAPTLPAAAGQAAGG